MSGSLSRYSNAFLLAAILLILGGVFAATKMPVSLFPFINFPRVVVSIDAGDRDVTQMAAEVTRPLEIALRAVPGVTRVRSTTSRGSADIAIDFPWKTNMAEATLYTQSAIAIAVPDLPAGVRFNVRRSDPTLFPVLGIALTSNSLDPNALRQVAELQVRPALTGVAGVAGVDILGGAPREIAVDVDPAKAQALGLSLDTIASTIGKQNVVRGVGKLEDRHRLYLVLGENQLTTVADLAATPLKGASSGVVTLGQIATIRPSAAPNYTRVTADGRDAVLINVRQSLQSDTVRIVRDVDQRLMELGLAKTIKATPFYDQSELVIGATNAVRDAILIGAILAGLVLFIFLRSGRLMIITGIMLPAVLASTCLILFALGMSFDMMTLGGMAAAVGLVVDDAVVMLEHIMRRLDEKAGSVASAAAEMGKPLLGSTAATIVIFLPLTFISGVTGGFFKALAVTMVTALGLSLLFARYLLPIIAGRWLKESDTKAAGEHDALSRKLEHWHGQGMERAQKRPARFLAIVSASLAFLGFLAWSHVPSGFMPAMDEGGFILDYKAQPGAALSDTDHLLRQVEQIIKATPEVTSYSRRTGAQLGGGLTEADEGDYFIRLQSGSRRPIDEVMTEIRQKVQARVPGLEIETAQLMEDLIGDLTAVPQPIEVKLFSDDPKLLNDAAKRVGKALGKVSGVVEVVDGLRVAGDAIRIRVDPGRAAQHGLDADGVASQVDALVAGAAATQMRIGEQMVTVRVRAPEDIRSRRDALGRLTLIAPDGHRVSLGELADISIASGLTQITREDLAPFIGVTGRLEGRDLGSAMKDVRAAVRDLKLPSAVRVDYGGLYAQQQQGFADLMVVFVSALLLTALLLTILFGRFAWTIAAIATVLLSAAAVLCGLWVTGTELDISALMGLTMVVGMVTELVIFLLAELPRDGAVNGSVLANAALKRLRPIVMSALIAILALAPLAFALSRGAGLQRPLAVAIIFGLLAAVPLVLVFLPVLIGQLSRWDRGNDAGQETI